SGMGCASSRMRLPVTRSRTIRSRSSRPPSRRRRRRRRRRPSARPSSEDMAGLPRRLGHAEEATLGEHLEELRGRLFVVLGAIALGTVVAFIFHGHVLDWLNRPLPPNHDRVVTFGYWVLLPRAIHFLTNYDTEHFQHLIQAKPYYNFVVTVLVGIVIVFQTPLVILGLVYLGVLSSRTLRRQRRMGYLITAAIALALPGPDPVTTFLELLPMWALFEGSIWLAFFFERRQAKAAPASATLGG